MADHGEGLFVVGVDDQSGDFIGLVRNQHFLQEVSQRDVSQGHLRGDALAIVKGGDAGQEIPGTRRAGLGHDLFEAGEAVGLGADGMGKCGHGVLLMCRSLDYPDIPLWEPAGWLPQGDRCALQ
ncbi:hypothetical protein D3C84_1023650 [compost metagenome]